MDPYIIAALSIALQEMDQQSISRKINQMDVYPTDVIQYVKKTTQRFKIRNPKLKMGHPIIQPRGQNH